MERILPSVLGVEKVEKFLNILSNCKTNENYINQIHVDIMDGIFVENIAGNIEDIAIIKQNGYIADVHFMVENTKEYVKKAAVLGADYITIHYEITNFDDNFKYLVELKNKYDFKIGIAICPTTDVNVLEKYVNCIDTILIMSVVPGKGGQPFIASSYDKIKECRKLFKNIRIVVDGGINNKNILNVIDAGANYVVIGSYITKKLEEIKDKVIELSKLI